MKCLLVISVLAAALLLLQAAPLRTTWYKLAPATQLFFKKRVGDIWSDCGQPGDHAKINVNSVHITPDPPQRGSAITITGVFTLDEEVTGGNIQLTLSINNIPFVNLPLDLCDAAQQAGLSCPLSKGNHSVSISEDIPYLAPPGNYSGNAKATDQNGQELACVDAKFTF